VFGFSLVQASTGWSQDAAPQDVPAAISAPADVRATSSTESYLSWFVRCSGLIGLFILGLSFYFVATVIRLFLDLHMDVAVPRQLMQHCDQFLQRNEVRGVYDAIQADSSNLSRILVAGLSELPFGLSESRQAMDRAGEAETVHMEKQISMLAVIGTLGPLIGLIGTLKGMISSFSVIAMSDVQLKTSDVATGISEALLLTFEGVALSVPAIYFHALFRNRVSAISAETMVQADRILRQIARATQTTSSHVATKAVPPTAPPVATRNGVLPEMSRRTS
jgi:biopolymer transport protein ExbB